MVFLIRSIYFLNMMKGESERIMINVLGIEQIQTLEHSKQGQRTFTVSTTEQTRPGTNFGTLELSRKLKTTFKWIVKYVAVGLTIIEFYIYVQGDIVLQEMDAILGLDPVEERLHTGDNHRSNLLASVDAEENSVIPPNTDVRLEEFELFHS